MNDTTLDKLFDESNLICLEKSFQESHSQITKCIKEITKKAKAQKIRETISNKFNEKWKAAEGTLDSLQERLEQEDSKHSQLEAELQELQVQQCQLQRDKEDILQEKETVEATILNINMKHLQFTEKKDSNENSEEEIRKVLSKEKDMYEARLCFTASNSTSHKGARVLTFTHVDERRPGDKFTIDISITPHNTYKIHSIHPEIMSAEKLQKVEDKLNDGSCEFKSFICYMRNQFKNSTINT